MADRPFLSRYKDRHGKVRWRFRRAKDSRPLPGKPGDTAFEEAYEAALQGKPIAKVVRHPNRALPRTLMAAWRLATAQNNMDWRQLGPSSRQQYMDRADRFLEMEIVPGLRYGAVPVADLKRRHIKGLLGSMADRPHAAADVLVVLRKMIAVALDEEWIEVDPTHRLKYRPEIDGHRAWTDAEREAFEGHYPIGTMQRTIYALALYTGQRRGDLVAFQWSDVGGSKLKLVQQKTGKSLILPIIPPLREALDAAPRHGDFVLGTEDGRQRSPEGLTNDWKRWTEGAGLEGCTLHGLRKTLGKLLAEQGATTRELMDALGHDAIAHAQLYSREAEQERMARQAFDKVKDRLRPRLKVVRGEPIG